MASKGYYDIYRDSDDELEAYARILELVEAAEDEIDIPDKSDLFDGHVDVNYETVLEDVPIKGRYLHPFFVKICNMLANGTSPIIVVVGKEGYGKSMAGLKIAETLHNLNVLRGSFDPSRQVVYEVIPFLLLYGDVTRTAVMFDEANETLNASDYHDKFNKAVSGVLRTQRKRENVNIFVCPEFKQLDSRVRNKVDVLIDLYGKQRANVTTYEYKHGKRGNRGLDYKWQNYASWYVPDVGDDLQADYESIDNQFKGHYHNKMLAEAIRERLDEIEQQSTTSL